MYQPRRALLVTLLLTAVQACSKGVPGSVIIIPAALTLEIGEVATLVADVDVADNAFRNGAATWEIFRGASFLEFVGPATGDTVMVRAVAEGSGEVRVAAENCNDDGCRLATDETPFTVLPPPVDVTIEGVVRDSAGGPGLADVYVQAVGDVIGGLPPVQTDAMGQYSIPVTEVDNYSMCAIGAIPASGIPQRFVNTNCSGEDVNVTSSSTGEILDLSVETGYHLAVIGCPCDYSGAPNDPFSLTFDYRAWNRASVPSTTSWIAVGIEGDGQDTALGADAGPFGAPTVDAAGSVTVDLTAPAAPGTYRIFARLLPVATAGDAITQYNSGFPAARERNYIQIGTVTVN